MSDQRLGSTDSAGSAASFYRQATRSAAASRWSAVNDLVPADNLAYLLQVRLDPRPLRASTVEAH